MVFGWFEKKPEIKVGDMVWDYWATSIDGSHPKKAIITQILPREGVFASQKYFVREQDTGFGSSYPRSRKELELIESAPEKPKAIRNQDSGMFKVFAKKEYRTGFGNIPKDAAARAAKKFSDGYVVFYNGMQCHMPSSDFHDGFEDVGQRDMRIRIETKEEKDVGGELYGYPPEDNNEDYATTLRKLEIAAQREQELAAKVAELEKKNEVSRREQVAEEYGIVTERHLWSVTVEVPRWYGKRVPGDGEQKSEVLTENRNMVEAAMAAEAMAKGIAENAHVLSIDYVRVIGALK